MKSDEVIALLAVEQLFEIRENAKEDWDIHACVEQYRAPHAVCFLHDRSPDQRMREKNGKKQNHSTLDMLTSAFLKLLPVEPPQADQDEQDALDHHSHYGNVRIDWLA